MAHDRAQVLLLVWPPLWYGHTDTMVGVAGGHTGLMQHYAPGLPCNCYDELHSTSKQNSLGKRTLKEHTRQKVTKK